MLKIQKSRTVINIFLNILVLKYKKHAIKGETHSMKAASLEPSLGAFCFSYCNIFFWDYWPNSEVSKSE